MVTKKQYPNHHIFETDIGGRTFTVETGKVAELCNAEAICRYGDTVVLVTGCCVPAAQGRHRLFPADHRGRRADVRRGPHPRLLQPPRGPSL